MSQLPEDIDSNLYEELKAEYYEQTQAPRVDNPQLTAALCKAAKLCEIHKIDPDVFISAQIRYFNPRSNQPRMYPNDYCPPKAIENVKHYLSVSGNSCTWKGSWENQKHYLACAVKNTNRTMEEILLDHNISFRPWFRCLITKEPIPSVIKKYGAQAYQELQLNDLQVFFQQLKREDKVEFDLSRIPEYW